MIRKTVAALVCIAWALWLGGLGALFLFVTRLFAFDRGVAKVAAPQLFGVFEKYQILLAALALIGAASWRLACRSLQATALFWLFACASLPAALGPMLITSRMNALVARGQTDSSQFRTLHGQSMMLYSGELLILLAAGVLLPWVLAEGNAKPA